MSEPGADRRLRGLGALTRAYLLQAFRSRMSLFWNFAFPLFWLFVFVFIFGKGAPARTTYLMPGLFTITIVAITFAGVSYRVVTEREKEILRRYRVTPVHPLALVLANSFTSLVLVGVALLLMAGVAWPFFGVRLVGGMASLLLVLLLGAVAFVPLGLLIGNLVPDMKTAPAVVNALFFPLILVSGAAIPFPMLPSWLQGVGRALPATYLVEALQGVMVRGEGLGDLTGALAVLVITAVALAAVSTLLFRWEKGESFERGRMAGALLLMAVLCGGMLWLGPSLGLKDVPLPEEGEGLLPRTEAPGAAGSALTPPGLRPPAGPASARGGSASAS